eukprot:TRINITY_DN8238_c0_g2_i5.p1 TRINITY_DN8238_c0_g2~~TRINITY_DN8238_c0_g2_i5.p1  ORF type:complete len:201 (+),score=18.16 TRINITY_DN8238_c0_g2_i5:369-971(+)
MSVKALDGTAPPASVAAGLLLDFHSRCSHWPSDPNAVAAGTFLPPPSADALAVNALEDQWKGWQRWNSCFTWRAATLDEASGPAFESCCLRSNPHLYRLVDDKWYRQPSRQGSWSASTPEPDDPTRWEKRIVVPAGLYFDASVGLFESHYSSMKMGSKLEFIHSLKVRFLLDPTVMSAALTALQRMVEDRAVPPILQRQG